MFLGSRSSRDRNKQDAAPGHRYIGPFGIVCLASMLFAASAIAVYTLVQLWPSASSDSSTSPQAPSNWLWWSGSLANETKLFIIVLAAGASGGLAHAVRSLYWYVGNRRLRSSWSLMYLSLPATGAGIALLTYLLLRGGLTTSFSDSEDVNPYGVAAISALAGLFAREAIEKMKAVFTTLLAPAEKGKDPIEGPRITGLFPLAASVGQRVKVKGHGLMAITQVKFAGGTVSEVAPSSDTMVEVPVPHGALSGPLQVTGSFGSVSSADDLTVLDAPLDPQAPRPSGQS